MMSYYYPSNHGVFLEPFCRNIRSIGVSALSSEGIAELFVSIDAARVEFQEVFLPDLLR